MIDVSKLSTGSIENKVIVLIRHGEKDETTGDLSKNGIIECIKLGELLKDFKGNIFIYSSPEKRCEDTAKILCESSNIKGYALLKELGKPGIQIKDETKYLVVYENMRCRDIYNIWKKGSYYNFLYSPEELKHKFYCLLDEVCSIEGIYIFISQSGTVSSVGYALGITNYSVENNEWVEYLDGFILSKKE